MHKRLLILVVMLVSVLAGFCSAAALAGGGSVCRPGGKLVAADTEAVVYLGREPGRAGGAAYLACRYGHHRVYVVGGPGVGSSTVAGEDRRYVLAGMTLAWESWEETQPPNGVSAETPEGRAEWVIFVRDLRTGRVLHKVPTGTSTVKGWVGVGPIDALVVKSDGAVAWIASLVGEGQHGYEVHAVDKTGSRLVASGTSIDPRSLALAGSTLYWTQGGVPMSAPLQ